MRKDTAAHIHRRIDKLQEGEIITTRECLHFGPRSEVDSVLCALVAKGIFIRLAWGVFCKPKKDNPDWRPPIEEIAAAKNAWFNKTTIPSPPNAPMPKLPPVTSKTRLRPINPEATRPLKLDTATGSSRFRCYNGQWVVARHVAPRKFRLSMERTGELVRKIWQQKPANVVAEVKELIGDLSQELKKQLVPLLRCGPARITDILQRHIPFDWRQCHFSEIWAPLRDPP
ncbi:MAG: hypothetical protein K2W95_15325 [Candidatus Obscuribacterales bacterium]|nr:hypothetical protein [Candidatus Obscuribacterales bacterium]